MRNLKSETFDQSSIFTVIEIYISSQTGSNISHKTAEFVLETGNFV